MGLLDGPWGLPEEEVSAPRNQLEAPRGAPWDTPTAEKVLRVAACAPTHTFSPPWAFRSSAQLGYNRPSQGGKTRAAPQHAPGAHGVVPWPGGQGWGTPVRGGSIKDTPSTGGHLLRPPESPPPGGAALARPLALDHARSASPRGMRRRSWGRSRVPEDSWHQTGGQPLPRCTCCAPVPTRRQDRTPRTLRGGGSAHRCSSQSPVPVQPPWTHGRTWPAAAPEAGGPRGTGPCGIQAC